MSLYHYQRVQKIKKEPVPSLLMAAMEKADIIYLKPLKKAFPHLYEEMIARNNVVGGKLEGE